MKIKFVLAAALVFFTLSHPFSRQAGAVVGQKYFSDGATPNPSGGWSYTGATDSSCLVCHKTGGSALAPDKTGYLATGHKNMLRKATVSLPGTGPDNLPYDTDASARGIFWNLPGPISLGTSTTHPPLLDGSCSLFGYTDQSSCQSAGGIWTTGSNSLFYILGGWMNTTAAAGAYNAAGTSIAAPGSLTDGSSYACARCHTTGVTLNTTISTTRPPEKTYPGINSYVNLDPDGNGPATTVSWAIGSVTKLSLEGVQCERCHNATNHGIASGPPSPKGESATALCLQCHRQEHTVPYAGGGLGANIHPTPYSDNGSLPASEPAYALPAIEVGNDSGYARQFYGYSTGMEFLNSVHAGFSGNFQQINDPSKYSSGFFYGACDLNGYASFDQSGCESAGGVWTDARGCRFNQANCESNGGIWTPYQGGCTTCHDVHQSTVAAVNAAAPFANSCPTCHMEGGLYSITNINHPKGTNTPLGDLSNIPAACAKCHMPKPNSGAGRSSHIWRINTDPSYTLFPTQDQWNAGQKTANTVPAGTYTNAVWIDLDLACGQCHGGGTAMDSPAYPKMTAPYLSKRDLSLYARNMHNAIPKALFWWQKDPTTNYKINVDAGSTICPPGVAASGNICTYSWDFGDGQTATASASPLASVVYSDATYRNVTLTVNAGGYNTTNTYVLSVAPAFRSSLLTASAGAPTVTGFTANFTASYANAFAPVTAKIAWGDGKTDSFAAGTLVSGTVVTHTYKAARTYKVRLTVSDGKKFAYATPAILVNTINITGNVAQGSMPAGANKNVVLTLKTGSKAIKKAVTDASGNYIFKNIVPGVAYTVVPSKRGYAFVEANPTLTVVTGSGDNIVSALTITAP